MISRQRERGFPTFQFLGMIFQFGEPAEVALGVGEGDIICSPAASMGEEHAIGELVGRITLETQMMGADASGEEIHPMVVVIERGCEELSLIHI